MGTIFFEVALTFYFAGFLLSIAGIVRKKDDLDKAVFLLSLVGFLLHTIYLIIRYVVSDQAPVFSMHEASSFFAWSIFFVFLLVYFKYRAKLFAYGVIFVFILMFVSAFFSRAFPAVRPEFKSFWIDIHAFVAVISVSAFSAAFIVSILYLLQYKSIKSKKFGGLDRILPSLEMLDKINYKLIFYGFPLYTFAILVGFIKYITILGFLFDPKETLSFITWFVYLVIFYLRAKDDWQKKKADYLTIFGFFLVIISFFCINLLTESFHKRL